MAKSSIKKIWISDGRDMGLSLVYRNKKKGKKKKQLQILKPIERTVRIGAKSGKTFFSTLESRQNRSNRKRKDGWLFDLPTNIVRANEKAVRKLDIPKVIGL